MGAETPSNSEFDIRWIGPLLRGDGAFLTRARVDDMACRKNDLLCRTLAAGFGWSPGPRHQARLQTGARRQHPVITEIPYPLSLDRCRVVTIYNSPHRRVSGPGHFCPAPLTKAELEFCLNGNVMFRKQQALPPMARRVRGIRVLSATSSREQGYLDASRE